MSEETTSAQLSRLHQLLAPEIRELVNYRHHVSVSHEEYLKQHAHIPHVSRLRRQRAGQLIQGRDELDFGKLYDLKAVFDAVLYPGARQAGLNEKDFKEKVAPILCPTYPRGVQAWYNYIDYDASGYVDWAKMLTYLAAKSDAEYATAPMKEGAPAGGSSQQQPHQSGSSKGQQNQGSSSPTKSAGSESEEGGSPARSTPAMVGTGHGSQVRTFELVHSQTEVPSGHHTLQCAHNTVQNNYVGLTNDGYVRVFDPVTTSLVETIHHPDGQLASMLAFSPERNFFYVGHLNGFVFMYDASGVRSRTGNLVKAMRITPASPSNEGENFVHKTVAYDPLRMAHYQVGVAGKRPAFVSIDVPYSILDTKKACTCQASHRLTRRKKCTCDRQDFASAPLLTAIHPARLGILPSSYASAKDPFFYAGFEKGHVGLYQAELVSSANLSHALAVWRPHTDAVTKIMCCSGHSELTGLLSSSMDASLVLTDVEKNQTKFRLVDRLGQTNTTGGSVDMSSSHDEGGWIDGIRPVTSFDVATFSPLIASCSNMRVVNLWSPTTGQKIAAFYEHKDAVIDVAFHQEFQQIISLAKDRTIRIWDLRTMRCAQTIVDKERRYCDESLTALMVDQKRALVVAFSGRPHLWRDKDSQEKAETGATWPIDYVGHIQPVQHVLANSVTDHLVTGDSVNLFVWDLHSYEFLFKFTPDHRISCMTFDSQQRRLLVGDEKGIVEARSFITGKLIKKFVGNTHEVTCLMHIPVTGDGAVEYPTCAAGTVQGELVMWPDKALVQSSTMSLAQLIQETPVGSVTSLAHHATDHVHTGHVTGIVLLSSGRLSVGTSTGDLFLLSIIAQTGPICLMCHRPSLVNTVMRPLFRPQSRSRPKSSMEVQSLWKRALSASKTERNLGSTQFTKFRHDTLQKLHQYCETIIPLKNEMLLVLYGDGDCTVWNVSPSDTQWPQVVACFPASSRLGESCTGAFWAARTTLVVADIQSTISCFQLRDLLTWKRSTAHIRPSLTGGGTNGRNYSNLYGVALTDMLRTTLKTIHDIVIVEKACCCVLGSDDCNVSIIDLKKPGEATELRRLGYSNEAALQPVLRYREEEDDDVANSPPWQQQNHNHHGTGNLASEHSSVSGVTAPPTRSHSSSMMLPDSPQKVKEESLQHRFARAFPSLVTTPTVEVDLDRVATADSVAKRASTAPEGTVDQDSRNNALRPGAAGIGGLRPTAAAAAAAAGTATPEASSFKPQQNRQRRGSSVAGTTPNNALSPSVNNPESTPLEGTLLPPPPSPGKTGGASPTPSNITPLNAAERKAPVKGQQLPPMTLPMSVPGSSQGVKPVLNASILSTSSSTSPGKQADGSKINVTITTPASSTSVGSAAAAHHQQQEARTLGRSLLEERPATAEDRLKLWRGKLASACGVDAQNESSAGGGTSGTITTPMSSNTSIFSQPPASVNAKKFLSIPKEGTTVIPGTSDRSSQGDSDYSGLSQTTVQVLLMMADRRERGGVQVNKEVNYSKLKVQNLSSELVKDFERHRSPSALSSPSRAGTPGKRKGERDRR